MNLKEGIINDVNEQTFKNTEDTIKKLNSAEYDAEMLSKGFAAFSTMARSIVNGTDTNSIYNLFRRLDSNIAVMAAYKEVNDNIDRLLALADQYNELQQRLAAEAADNNDWDIFGTIVNLVSIAVTIAFAPAGVATGVLITGGAIGGAIGGATGSNFGDMIAGMAAGTSIAGVTGLGSLAAGGAISQAGTAGVITGGIYTTAQGGSAVDIMKGMSQWGGYASLAQTGLTSVGTKTGLIESPPPTRPGGYTEEQWNNMTQQQRDDLTKLYEQIRPANAESARLESRNQEEYDLYQKLLQKQETAKQQYANLGEAINQINAGEIVVTEGLSLPPGVGDFLDVYYNDPSAFPDGTLLNFMYQAQQESMTTIQNLSYTIDRADSARYAVQESLRRANENLDSLYEQLDVIKGQITESLGVAAAAEQGIRVNSATHSLADMPAVEREHPALDKLSLQNPDLNAAYIAIISSMVGAFLKMLLNSNLTTQEILFQANMINMQEFRDIVKNSNELTKSDKSINYRINSANTMGAVQDTLNTEQNIKALKGGYLDEVVDACNTAIIGTLQEEIAGTIDTGISAISAALAGIEEGATRVAFTSQHADISALAAGLGVDDPFA